MATATHAYLGTVDLVRAEQGQDDHGRLPSGGAREAHG